MDFRPIATDPEVMRYINGGIPWDDERIQDFVQRQIQLYEERGYCRWKLTPKGGSGIAGFCGVGLSEDVPEIGWWLAPRYWGRGLATEAARVALRHAFETSTIDRFISIVRPANLASVRVMEKIRLAKETEYVKDGVPLLRYAITRSQYFNRPDLPSHESIDGRSA
jgi:RimJ/RimL family protein N-acetyltransferase